MAVKLHRCPMMFLKVDGHPCWRVQKALDDAGVEYEVAKGPLLGRNRTHLEEISGQAKYPTIEFENGNTYRAESKAMAERIRAGNLLDPSIGAPPSA